MAGQKWISSKFKGVRFYQHETRKHGVKYNRYLAIRYQKDGKRIEEGIGWTSERDPADGKYWTEEKAFILLERLKGAARQGIKEAPTRLSEQRQQEADRRNAEQEAQLFEARENICFDDYIRLYWSGCGSKKTATLKNEKMLYERHIKPVIGIIPMKEVNNDHIIEVMHKMKNLDLSARTRQYALQLIRQVYRHAELKPPIKKTDWPKLDNMKQRFLSIEESDQLLAALKERSETLHDQALMSLHCGLRYGEIANLTWNCINWSSGTIAILNAKAGSRTAYLTEVTRQMLINRNPGKPDDLVFGTISRKTGEIEKPIQASKIFSDVIDSLKFNEGVTDNKMKVTFHTLRHTYATHLFETTNDLYLTQKALGHSTITMTQRYAKMTDDRLRRGAQALEERFNTKPEGANVIPFQRKAGE